MFTTLLAVINRETSFKDRAEFIGSVSQWWGPKGDAKRLGSSKDNVYLSVPIPMLALVACAVSPIFYLDPPNIS